MSESSVATHKIRRWLRREAMPLAVMLILLLAARSSLANHYHVPSGSMQPTLQPGDRVVVDMRAYGLRLPFTETILLAGAQPRRGDVAVFDSRADGIRLIKRVAAVAGDHVQLLDGHLYLNGQALATGADGHWEQFDQRVAHLGLDHGGGPDIVNLLVPPGKVLVLGDNRGNSQDGRFFGFVDADRIYGKAVAVYWRRGEGPQWFGL